MSSYKGLDLFGSGPHRFVEQRRGLLLEVQYFVGGGPNGTIPIEEYEPSVMVAGRLVATTESALWALRDAILAQVFMPPQSGDLVEDSGRTWTEMNLVRFAVTGPTDRGRAYSVAYEATFLDYKVIP